MQVLAISMIQEVWVEGFAHLTREAPEKLYLKIVTRYCASAGKIGWADGSGFVNSVCMVVIEFGRGSQLPVSWAIFNTDVSSSALISEILSDLR